MTSTQDPTSENPAQTFTAGAAEGEGAATWWRDAVVYQVYPRSFRDSDGDGMGDLPGITERLPYLASLGVDALWLSPFYVSPQHDAGYDVADYTDVDPRFGTLADFDALVARAKVLDLKVMVDFVPNHSSSDHELFQQALAAAPGSPEREMYIFRDGRGEHGELPPNNWTSIFHGDAWTRVENPDGTPGQWYLHIFDTTQPDFDWENPRVRELFRGWFRFWLDRGVDGFRIDVAHGMAKAPGLPDAEKNTAGLIEFSEDYTPPYFDQDGVHEIHRMFRSVLDEYDDRIMVLEAWVPAGRMARYLAPDEAHQVFNFSFLEAEWDASVIRDVVRTSLERGRELGTSMTWVLSNHDVVRHATRYGYAPGSMSFGDGLDLSDPAPDAALGRERARAATLLMLSLPGSAYLYQGEELGLPEVRDLPAALREDPAHLRTRGTEGEVPGRDGCRVPLPWESGAPAFGFSPTGASWLPQPAEFGPLAVDAQDGVEGSVLEMYRSALRLRRAHGLGGGVAEPLDALPGAGAALPGSVLALRNGDVIVVVNTGGSPVGLPADAEVLLASHPEAVLTGAAGTGSSGSGSEGSGSTGPGRPSRLAPDSTVWLRDR